MAESTPALPPSSLRAFGSQLAGEAGGVEIARQRKRERDAADDSGNHESQCASPAARQCAQILLQFLLDTLTCRGALRFVDAHRSARTAAHRTLRIERRRGAIR